MGSNASMYALGALFQSVTLVITGSAELSSVEFANALAGTAAIEALFQFFSLGKVIERCKYNLRWNLV